MISTVITSQEEAQGNHRDGRWARLTNCRSGVECWQEFTIILQAWHLANRDFMTAAQAIHKVFEMFRAAGETAAADSHANYMLAGSTTQPTMFLLAFLLFFFKLILPPFPVWGRGKHSMWSCRYTLIP